MRPRRVRRKELLGAVSGQRSPARKTKLAFSIARAPQRDPTGPGHVIHAHDAMVASVRHVSLPGRVHEDFGRPLELVGPARPSAPKVVQPAPVMSFTRTTRLLPLSTT